MKESELEKSRFSRRNFLKAVGLVGTAVALAGANPLEVLGTERVYKPGEYFRRGDRIDKRIYFTIDDGGSLTRVTQAADFAYKVGAKITFFPTGLNVAKDKSVWAKVISQGHDIGNHTWNHQELTGLTITQIRDELSKQRQVVQEAAKLAGIDNYPQHFLRPPYGHGVKDTDVIQVCREQGYVMALWSSDPQGWRKTVTESMIYQRAVSDFGNGIILLQHTDVKDMDVFPKIVNAAISAGFAVDKTIPEGIKTTFS